MFPEFGPKSTESEIAEPSVYWRLAKQLPDDFCVIHSLPWLSTAAKEIDNRSVPTGEIDFLILHPELGVLALEVKGGEIIYEKHQYVLKRTRKKIYPVNQVRRGTHGLAEWLLGIEAGAWRIGYAFIFFDNDTTGKSLPPAMIDASLEKPQKILLGRNDFGDLGDKVVEVMKYWKEALGNKSPGEQKISGLIDALLPEADYSLYWLTRIKHDDLTWLQLTDEQSQCLKRTLEEDRFVISGSAGTGKTLIATECARELSKAGKRVLFLTHNIRLTEKLQNDLSDSKLVDVMTRYELCRRAARKANIQVPTYTPEVSGQKELQDWYQSGAVQALQVAFEKQKLPEYDALVIDEGQVFEPSWWTTLSSWFSGKKISVCCDSTQVFEFEEGISPDQVAKATEAPPPFVLTLNLRSPKVVFEKLQQLHKTSYQQISPRTLEEDALEEIVVDNTEEALRSILMQLTEEGIPKEAIVVLYENYLPPEDILSEFRVKAESIMKYRGLEMPVVVVWAQGATDIALQCAYSRATSRCIAIFSAYGVVEKCYGKFGQLLLQSNKAEIIRREAELGSISTLLKNHLDLIRVTPNTAEVCWCEEWQSWLIFPDSKGEIASRLWALHISLNSDAPVYSWGLNSRNALYSFCNPQGYKDDRYTEYLEVGYCDICNCLAPFSVTTVSFTPLQRDYTCKLCSKKMFDAYPQTIQFERYDSILSDPENATLEEKRSMGACLVALGSWRKLTLEEIEEVLPLDLNGKIGFSLAKVFTAVDLMKPPGSKIVFKELADKYLRWCPDLSVSYTATEWRQTVSYTISGWIKRNLILKVDKGVYEKI